MLQFHCECSSGNDPCHFANFANDVNQNVPTTTETELDAGCLSTRNRERKRILTSAQNPNKIDPESSEIPTKNSPRAPKELPSSSKERPRRPQISQQNPSSSQGLSKVRRKGLRGSLWDAFCYDLGLQIEVSEPMLTHFLS